MHLGPEMNGKLFQFAWRGNDGSGYCMTLTPTAVGKNTLLEIASRLFYEAAGHKHKSTVVVHWADGMCDIMCTDTEDIKKARMRLALL